MKAVSKVKKSKNKGTSSFFEKFKRSDLTGETANLMPGSLFYYLVFIALVLPNLIFSGPRFFDTLHIMKWVFAMVPIALISLLGGFSLLIHGSERTGFKINLFGWLWFFMLFYVSIQPLWVDITSWSTYFKEWFFFATLWATYVFSYNLFHDDGYHKLILWFANINAAINVIFADILIRVDTAPYPFIMNVPGNYIGNTGQQNMFALWISMALLNSAYLHMAYAGKEPFEKKDKILQAANLLLVAVNSWGLWNSTGRAGFMGLFVGLAVLALIVHRVTGDRAKLKRVIFVTLQILVMMAVVVYLGVFHNIGRGADLLGKTKGMFDDPANVAQRKPIWQTSWAMIQDHGVGGVGIGHYKWHYLEAQAKAIEKHPENVWQYTYWAHSEYLQWIAEFGIVGSLILLVAAVWWITFFVRAMVQRKELSMEAIWACSLLFLISFVALFTRPYHRIENILWYVFAFAITNRELLPLDGKWFSEKKNTLYRALGALFVIGSIAGLFFLYTGLRGDQYMRDALRTNSAKLQAERINKARALVMSRDEAEEQYAYHLIAVARVTQNPADWNRAIEQLHKAFLMRPKAKELFELFNLAQQTGNNKIVMELLPLMPKMAPAPPVSAPPEPAGS